MWGEDWVRSVLTLGSLQRIRQGRLRRGWSWARVLGRWARLVLVLCAELGVVRLLRIVRVVGRRVGGDGDFELLLLVLLGLAELLLAVRPRAILDMEDGVEGSLLARATEGPEVLPGFFEGFVR